MASKNLHSFRVTNPGKGDASHADQSDPATSAIAVFLEYLSGGPADEPLASVLGPQRAARFHWECALLALAKALRIRKTEVFVFFSPEDKRTEIESLVMSKFGRFEGRFLAREGGNLREQIHSAFKLLRAMKFSRTFYLNAISPTLPQEYIEQAVVALDKTDYVLGASWKGECYLIGSRDASLRVFDQNMGASGLEIASVYEGLAGLGLSCTLLPRWHDVNTPDDLPFLEGHVRRADFQRLRAILEEQRDDLRQTFKQETS